jgi:hypothetical protein
MTVSIVHSTRIHNQSNCCCNTITHKVEKIIEIQTVLEKFSFLIINIENTFQLKALYCRYLGDTDTVGVPQRDTVGMRCVQRHTDI